MSRTHRHILKCLYDNNISCKICNFLLFKSFHTVSGIVSMDQLSAGIGPIHCLLAAYFLVLKDCGTILLAILAMVIAWEGC